MCVLCVCVCAYVRVCSCNKYLYPSGDTQAYILDLPIEFNAVYSKAEVNYSHNTETQLLRSGLQDQKRLKLISAMQM